VISDCWHF